MIGALVFFVAGLGIAVAWTEVVGAVRDRRALLAGAWTVVLDAVTMGSTWWVIEAQSVPSLLAYAVGGGLGTYLTLRRSCR